jgi:phage-related baseplate assembly protein
MSNENHKADQIAYRVFAKLSLVATEARDTVESKPSAKVDKWVCHSIYFTKDAQPVL